MLNSEKRWIIEIFAILIVCAFLSISIESPTDLIHTTQNVKLGNNGEILHDTFAYHNTSSVGYVKCTLILSNNTLWNGNIAKTCTNLNPSALTIDSSNGYVYVDNSMSNNVSVIDGSTNKVVASIPVGIEPSGVVFDSLNGNIYVTNFGTYNVSVIDGSTNTVISTISVGVDPDAIAFDSLNGYIYVSNYCSDSVSAINGSTNNVVTTISVGVEPDAIAFDSLNGYIYVANYYSGCVSVIEGSTNKVVASIPVGVDPNAALFNSLNGYIYVSNYCSDSVSAINGSTNNVVSTISVGPYPGGMTYDSENGFIYLSKITSDNISVINASTNKVIGSIAVGSGPCGVAFDKTNNYVYVTNLNSGSVSIIFDGHYISTYSIEFSESGLPLGAIWSVGLNGSIQSTTISTITFTANNGSYSYTVEPVKDYSVSSPGNIKVNGTNVKVSVIFKLLKETHFKYSIIFTESGLPSGAMWSITLNGSNKVSNSSTIEFTEQNGSYSYSIRNVSGYTISSASGSLSVNGSNVFVTIIFKEPSTAEINTTSLGIWMVYPYIELGVVILATVGIGSAVFFSRKKK